MLTEFDFFEVGGAVRDELMGLQSKDIDYSVVADDRSLSVYTLERLFTRLQEYLTGQGYEIFLSTPDCVTIRAKFPKTHVHAGTVADFVLARKELGYKEGTREPIVVPGTLLDDLARRDFTVNAIAKDSTGRIYDPYNGVQDITDRILKTPLETSRTMNDDPLRLLRAIRFAITKGFRMSPEIKDALRSYDYHEKMVVVSEERIREELYKCFRDDTALTLGILYEYPRLLGYIFSRTNLWLKPTNEK